MGVTWWGLWMVGALLLFAAVLGYLWREVRAVDRLPPEERRTNGSGAHHG
ncbi:MAG: hypothetical protein ACOYY2_12080 [Actinomycetota bacterium]